MGCSRTRPGTRRRPPDGPARPAWQRAEADQDAEELAQPGRRRVGVRGRRAVAVPVTAGIQQDEDERRVTLEQLACGLEAARPRRRHHDQVDRPGRDERARFRLVGHLADDVNVHPERRAQCRPEGRIPVDDESTCPLQHRDSQSQVARPPSTGRRAGTGRPRKAYATEFCGDLVSVASSDETPWSSAQRAAAVRFCTPIFR